MALLYWTDVFYTPYTYQVLTFNYDDGVEPPVYFCLTVSRVVVPENDITYEARVRMLVFAR